MSKERKLHPIALVVELIQKMKGNVYLLIGLGLSAQTILRDVKGVWGWFAFVAFILLVFGLVPVIHFLTFRYQIDEDGLRVRKGLIFRKNILIPYERIQTIQQKQWFFFLPFHVTQVLVETAGGEKVEADLSAVPVSVVVEINAFRNARLAAAGVDILSDERAEEQLLQEEVPNLTIELKMSEILLMSLTSGGILGVLCIIAVFFTEIADFLPVNRIEQQLEAIWSGSMLVLTLGLAVVLFLLWGGVFLKAFFQFFDFKLKRFSDRLVVEKGLFQRNQTTIPFDKIQSVQVIETPIRRVLGWSAIQVVTAGGMSDKEELVDSGSIFILPIVKKARGLHLLAELVESCVLPDEPMEGASKAGIWRNFFLNSLSVSILVLTLSILFFPYGILSVVGYGLAYLAAWLEYRTVRFYFSKQRLILQTGIFGRNTHFVLRNKVQSIEKRQSFFMRKGCLAHLSVYVKSGVTQDIIKARFLKETDVHRVYEWLRPVQ